MKKTKTSKIVPPNVKVMFLPIVYIVILLVVSVFAVRIGIDRIGKQRKELKTVQKVENTLLEKEAELRNRASINLPLVTPAMMALPNSNPALMVISNMKALAASHGVSVNDLRVSGGSSGGVDVGRLSITFAVSGSFVEVLNFMKETKSYLPLMRTGRMEVRINNEITEIDTSARAYFSAYPDKLPPIMEPIDKITDEEYQILNELTQKQTPIFFELEPTGPVSRPNPFSFEN